MLHVLSGLPFGGNETLCLQLMSNLPGEVRWLLNIGSDGEMRKRFDALPGFELFEVPYHAKERTRFVWQVFRVLRRLRPRAVIVYPLGLHLLVALAARLAGVKRIVVHAGNPPPHGPCQRRTWKQIVRASALLGVPIVSCSRHVQAELRRLGCRLPRGSLVIPHGIDTEEVARRANASRRGRSSGVSVVGMVARLDEIKDQATLIQAMAHVRGTKPGTQLWLIGDGKQRKDLEKLVDELSLGNTVEFLGMRHDVPELLGRMDIYVFSTTRSEGFGLALAEAIAAGLPVIASDVPACRELLREGQAGRLVPPEDPCALAEVIDEWLEDRSIRDEWVQRGQQLVPDLSVQACAAAWQSMVEE